ncbi:MAG: hypothetical protein EA402_04205 [Planctomycetota bacterium]|nr:MAG: hypothetical protein EA402_04205 [Planctomycetota bacterium]
MSSTSFDPLTQDLQGLHSIEASAGTGKTYTIALLWLRLICEEGLPVERVLVSTFTRAATAELRDRLRQGLLEVLSAIEAPAQAGGAVGVMVRRILDGHHGRPALSPEALRLRVRRALSDFDLAPISTIHGFCSALIARHCLELGADPDADLVESSSVTLERMVVDELIRAATTTSAPVENCVSAAMAIAQEAGISDESLELPVVLGSADAAAWSQARQAVIDSAAGAVQRITNKSVRNAVQTRIDEIQFHTILTAEAVGIFSQKLQKESGKKNDSGWFAATHAPAIAEQAPEFFHACEQARQTARDIHNDLWCRLVQRVREDYPAAKARLGERSFDDLLFTVLQALQSPRGNELAQALRQRFQAVMVDECQDSDAVQIQVFRRLFAGDAVGQTAAPTRCFLVIGDPKQSIYRFRGADLASYRSLSALALPAASMDTNWRSDAPLVAAIDQLYQNHHADFADSANTQPIAYVPVSASPDHQQPRIRDPWLAQHPPCAAASQQALLGLFSSNDKARPAKADLAAQCAAECQRLLQQKVQIEDRHSHQWRDIQADDIAIIAGTRGDLNQVRRALQRLGIPSQFSGRGLGSVLASDEARDLQVWLDCLAASEAAGSDLLNHLLAWAATPLMACSASDCFHLAQDPARQAALADSCRRQAAALQRQGPLPVLLRLLNKQDRLQRCLQRHGGERQITNWRHVADLLQAAWASRAHAARNAAGCADALMALMAEALHQPDHSVERLETDLSAVQLVTTHGCKGLEYPVTFCPFLWQQKSRSKRRSDMQVAIARTSAGSALALRGAESFEERQKIAMAQQDEEEQRLCYVALTRARHRCYLGLAAVADSRGGHENGAHRSALARLLGLDKCDPAGELIIPLAQWREHLQRLLPLVEPLDDEPDSSPQASPPATLTELDLVMPPDLSWASYVPPRIASFSGLAHSSRQEVVHNRDEDEDDLAPRKQAGLFAHCGDGVALGNRVHNLLEAVIGNRAELDTVLPPLEAGQDAERSTRQQHLRQALQTVLDTPFCFIDESTPASLYDRREQAFAEMHFLLPVADLRPADLAAALLADPAMQDNESRRAWAEQIGAWSFQRLQGFLQGFIDLTVRDQHGRWWVLDYKTNQLPAYDWAHCEASMLHSHYLLQGRLYLLALHRHLRHHLDGYDPAQHLGGCAYAYVRGFDPAQPGQGLWQERVAVSAILALDACCTGHPSPTPQATLGASA